MSALDGGKTCLISQQHPPAGFSAGAAMARNKLIYALSKLTVVVAADHETGGTWAGAVEAMTNGYGRVTVWEGKGQGPGDTYLLEMKARPFSAVTNLGVLLDESPAEPDPVQMSLIEGTA